MIESYSHKPTNKISKIMTNSTRLPSKDDGKSKFLDQKSHDGLILKRNKTSLQTTRATTSQIGSTLTPNYTNTQISYNFITEEEKKTANGSTYENEPLKKKITSLKSIKENKLIDNMIKQRGTLRKTLDGIKDEKTMLMLTSSVINMNQRIRHIMKKQSTNNFHLRNESSKMVHEQISSKQSMKSKSITGRSTPSELNVNLIQEKDNTLTQTLYKKKTKRRNEVEDTEKFKTYIGKLKKIDEFLFDYKIMEQKAKVDTVERKPLVKEYPSCHFVRKDYDYGLFKKTADNKNTLHMKSFKPDGFTSKSQKKIKLTSQKNENNKPTFLTTTISRSLKSARLINSTNTIKLNNLFEQSLNTHKFIKHNIENEDKNFPRKKFVFEEEEDSILEKKKQEYLEKITENNIKYKSRRKLTKDENYKEKLRFVNKKAAEKFYEGYKRVLYEDRILNRKVDYDDSDKIHFQLSLIHMNKKFKKLAWEAMYMVGDAKEEEYLEKIDKKVLDNFMNDENLKWQVRKNDILHSAFKNQDGVLIKKK